MDENLVSMQRGYNTMDRGTFENPPNRKRLYITLGAAGVLLFVVAFVIGFYSAPSASNTLQPHEEEQRELPTIPPQPTKWRQFAYNSSQNNKHCPEDFKKAPPLLIISMDGFRADYLQRQKSPALKTLMEAGVHAPYMRPVFPSKTFPNHYTIVTGLYPESHGIIENNMHDPMLKNDFHLGAPESMNPAWWQGEPIWITAKKQNKTSATFFWPGSEVEINGTYPNLYMKYDRKVPHVDRVDQIVKWLSLRKGRPDVLTLYFEEPDSQGHQHGPDSSKVTQAIAYVDKLMDRLMNALYEKHLLGCFNIVILSDHGMQTVSCDRVIYPLEVLQRKDPDLAKNLGLFGGPVARYKTDKKDLIPKLIDNLDCVPHMVTTLKEDLPARFHYVKNSRIEPVVSLLDAGWQASDGAKCSETLKGQHGYDNKVTTMRAMFIGYGPAFKQNFTSLPFENIELYNLFCELTNLIPAANNGTKGSLQDLLRKPTKQLETQKQAKYTVAKFLTDTTIGERNTISGCQCKQIKSDVTEDLAIKQHVPWGIPYFNGSQTILCNKEFVTSYDVITKQPRWTGFQITSIKKLATVNPCWTAETRLDDNQTVTCSKDFNQEKLKSEGLTMEPLFKPNFSNDSTSDWMSLSNAVLMYEQFQSDISTALRNQLGAWFSKFERLYVITGPIFDSKHKSSSTSVPIPSHFFIIVTNCNSPSIEACEPDTIAFLLPHRKNRSPCQSSKEFLQLHIARIRDIELKTGHSFFFKNQTVSLQQRTKLEVDLWGGL